MPNKKFPPIEKDSITVDMSNWMSRLPNKNLPINQIAIPGSHNSFTFDIKLENGVCRSSMPCFLGFLGSFKCFKKTFLNFSVCQQRNVHQQLEAGVRYFDIRIAEQTYNEAYEEMLIQKKTGKRGKHHLPTSNSEQVSSKIYCVHSLYCNPTFYYLKRIKEFLLQNPKEVVILDFNHSYDMRKASHKRFIETLFALFGRMICPFKPLEKVTISFLETNGYQVIILYAVSEGSSDYLFPQTYIRSKWPNKTNPTDILKVMDSEWELSNLPNKFKVYQGVLTPNTRFFLKNRKRTLKETLIKCGMISKFTTWVRERTKEKKKEGQMNIFLSDFVDLESFCSAVIELNF